MDQCLDLFLHAFRSVLLLANVITLLLVFLDAWIFQHMLLFQDSCHKTQNVDEKVLLCIIRNCACSAAAMSSRTYNQSKDRMNQN